MPAAQTLRSPEALASAGLVPPERVAALEAVAARYAVAVTPTVAELIDADNPADPIARQFLPDPAELEVLPVEDPDPIGDDAHSPVEGIVHRYPDRVLLKITHTCAVYCRFCFRRERVGPQGEPPLAGEALDRALNYIAERPEIWEVIVTGGDPFVLSGRRLGTLMRRLAAIDHVKVVRFHTRVPVVDPTGVDEDLLAALKTPGPTVYVAVHANHPREMTPEARAACARLFEAGVALVSQTVLLRGVNDDVETLGALMRAFVEARVKPYYLHHGDLAPGTAHLRTSLEEGQALMRALRGRYSGLCQPTYVLDIPGGHGKAPAGPAYIAPADVGHRVEDPQGTSHVYPR
ncbi:MAG: lysine-2,3-aminomutase-like protein [Phenylobacterium sp.]|uniref:lysine-2,3-aminomutase-like protein n=1 Tax=Phenylobacterium sp. TaxID=1871053 RepID=UPI003919FB08